MKLTYLSVVLSLVGSSCAYPPREPKVWMEKGTSLAHYKTLQVLPVQNESGKTFDFDVAATLTEQLVAKLRAKGYSVQSGSPQGEETLLLRSTLVAYEVGSSVAAVPAATHCTVRTALLDKRTGRLLGEMLTSKEIRTGGLLFGAVIGAIGLAGTDIRILESVAEGLADELERRIGQPQGQP